MIYESSFNSIHKSFTYFNTCFTDVGWKIEYWQNVIISYLGQSFSSNWTPKKFDTESCSASHCSNFRIGKVFLDVIVFPGF